MSNIHGLANIGNNQRRNHGESSVPDEEYQAQRANVPLLTNFNQGPSKDPRKESLWDMYKFLCCPTFNRNQFIVWITVFDIFYFLLSLILSNTIQGEFLQPDNQSLIMLGARYPYKMKYGEIWRFFTSTLLHANFMHLFSNIVTQLMFGVSLESTVGRRKMIILYAVSGVGGVLFSSLISDELSVGASTSIFGLLGGQLGFLYLNWSSLANLGTARCQLLIIILLMVFINLLIGLESKNIDNWGHIGGFLVGFFTGVAVFQKMRNNSHSNNSQKVSKVIVCGFFLGGLIGFYVGREPQP